MNSKRWNVLVIGITTGFLAMIGAVTVFVDPFLHYHKGQEFLEYPLKDERYQNDGIARNYEYDSIIVGTSMCQNFLCSEFDELWEAHSVKMTTSGASYHESNANIRRSLSHNANVKYVVCSLDGNRINYEYDKDEYTGYPEYLYDENIFNDVYYLLNKEVLPKTLAVLNYTRAGNMTTDRDEYSSWGKYKTYGKETVMASFQLVDRMEEDHNLTQEDMVRIQENIQNNFLETAYLYPDTTFYFFFPPYSICYWEALERTNQLNMQIEAQEAVTELLLEADNVHVFDFSYRTDITGDLENYTDTMHYGDWINSQILQMMNIGEGELTLSNYKKYFEELKQIYKEYDYEKYKTE